MWDDEKWARVKVELERAPGGLSARTAAARINMSVQEANQILRQACEEGLVMNEGLGAAAVFRLPRGEDREPQLYSPGRPATAYNRLYGGPRT